MKNTTADGRGPEDREIGNGLENGSAAQDTPEKPQLKRKTEPSTTGVPKKAKSLADANSSTNLARKGDPPTLEQKNKKIGSGATGSASDVAFLSKRVKSLSMGNRIWELPKGASPLHKGYNFVILKYNGNQYKCIKLTENIGGTHCMKR